MRPESCRLNAYADGELGPAERAQVEAHLAGCAKCAGKLDWLRREATVLARAGGGLLLHVDLARLVERQLPERRRSMVLVHTQGVRRQLAMAGFGVALALTLFSFVFPAGPSGTLGRLTGPAETALFLNWALMVAAGSLMVWPEKAALLEARLWSLLRGGRPQVTANERMLVQALGLVFLVLSTCLHLLLVSGRGLPL